MTTQPSLDHQQFQDDLAAWALGNLDAEATERLENHLAGCPECRARLDEYLNVVALLPLGLPAVRPRAAARDELLARARAERPGRLATLARHPHWTTPARLMAAALAAVLVLALGIGGWAVTRPEKEPARSVADWLFRYEGARVVALSGSAAAPGAAGQMILLPDDRTGGLIVSGLPVLPAGRTYQLWFVLPDGTRVNGGIFEVDDSGAAVVRVKVPADLDTFQSIGVTQEPAGGSPAPTGSNVLRAEL